MSANPIKIAVIGGGPAGEAAACYAAKLKADVTLIEKDQIGGICLNRGCIPSKTLLSFGKKLAGVRRTELWNPSSVREDGRIKTEIWQKAQANKDAVVRQIGQDLGKKFRMLGVKIISGEASFTGPKELLVKTANGAEKMTFDKIILAAGSEPVFPPPLDSFRKQLMDSDAALSLEEIPLSMIIVGGGAVGCEFACLYHELGCAVTLIEKTPNLLPGEDDQVVNALRKSFETRGIRVKDSVTVQRVEKKSESWTATLSDGTVLNAEQILVCVGRRPAAGTLQFENARVEWTSRGLTVDAGLRTANPDIYAAGDVTGLSLLAHAASAQGETAAANALGESKIYDGTLIPRCLYTWPEVASVGLWKSQAAEKGYSVKTQRFFFQASGRALAEGEPEGFVQIVSDDATDRVIGAQIIGAHATELIHIPALAIKKNMTRAEILQSVFAHPTFAEAIRGALSR